ncbi:efflux RND transporter permease subunit [Nodularia sphaerocarpa]|uniref:efflux RND transporter permease subunit n=2 Tax=Nodularia sphaerocarpa TaxID=137816 RepID=UPI001EFC109B|nr:efflux RND transporter permease subunit [Nodularia sphaerocarpa]MDB9374031.1 efflux RND transporter permease subunit [Nodularia sphaerocarpa CS-585]ULP72425.1 Multidrug resistance protein MdtC [Nodularia sphaerocarpa UHCC 0038]
MHEIQKAGGFSISTISIRQHIGTLMLALAVLVMGVFFIIKIPVDLLPSITYPRIGVRIAAPGLSPEVAIDEVTRPLESAFSATEGVLQIFSQTREGQISLDLYFQPGGDIDQALNDATASFNRARGRLPDTIETPRLFKFDPSQLPVYEFALTSPSLDSRDLRVFAEEELVRELGVVPGVASVDVSGGVKEEVRVNLDLNRLQALGVGLTDVLDELRDRNQDVSGGRLLGSNSEPLIRTVGRFQSADEIKNLTFEVNSDPDSNNQSPVLNRRVYLRDFAEVIDGSEQQRIYVLLNGEPSVKISIQKQPDANTVNVVDGVKKRLAELQASSVIPEGTILTATLDESQFIRNSISNVVTSGLIGTGLAAFAVLLFLGSLRQTFIIVIAIPLASLAAIILMGMFGLSLNVFSLGGLALGVGIVVDNSIVMLENIAEGAGMTPGKDTKTRLNSQQLIQQAEKSSREVESALIASTSTNLVAVMPFLLIGGFISLLFNELILTITFSVAASILIAVTIIPMLTSRTLAWKFSSGLSKFWLLQEFNKRFDTATNRYRQFLSDILRWRFLTVAIALIIFGGGSLWIAPQIPQEILPRISTGQARLNAQFPPGTPLETNRKVMEMVDDILLKQPETEYVFTTAGGALFGTNVNANPLRGTSTITLKPGTDTEAYVERVTQEFNQLNLVGIRLRLSPGEVRGLILSNSPARGADVDIILQGNDTENLEQAGREVLTALEERATLVRFRPDADDRQPELQIRPDWERVANFGLSTSNIGDTIQTAVQGSVPTQLQRSNRLVDVRVQLNESSLQEVSQLERLPLFVDNNRQVRLSDVATITQGQAPGEIQRINQRQVVIFAGNLIEGANLSDAFTEVDTILASLNLPEGVSILPSSAAASNQELQNSLQLLAGLASFLVFVVMAVQYNSLIDPLVIMLTIPLALAGGIFGLYMTNTAIGATVIVGAVLLVGIVVNNAIIMVELANQIIERDKVDRKTAILQAAPQRLRPILMTTITTVLGMFPLALGIGEGSEFLQPLGVVVFSGLSLATLLTLFIIPCFYTMLHDLLNWRWAKPILIRMGGWKKKFY